MKYLNINQKYVIALSLFLLSSCFSPICKIIITTPIMNRQMRQAMTIKARELVGLIKSSRFQSLTLSFWANIMS